MHIDIFGAINTALLVAGIGLVLRLDRRMTRVEINLAWTLAALKKWGMLQPPNYHIPKAEG